MVFVGMLLCLACSLSLTKLLLCVFAETQNLGDISEADVWLKENQLQQYQHLFKKYGSAATALVGPDGKIVVRVPVGCTLGGTNELLPKTPVG
uniref:Uncharacterized protein n=1 Tax=Timema bartmani TaxID=61472 RepID=A0A7R9F0K0_9NEOP|nr:unnamed protein product [Timema bartmani]